MGCVSGALPKIAKDLDLKATNLHKLPVVLSCEHLKLFDHISVIIYIYIYGMCTSASFIQVNKKGGMTISFGDDPQHMSLGCNKQIDTQRKHNTTFSNQLACLFFSNYMVQVKH